MSLPLPASSARTRRLSWGDFLRRNLVPVIFLALSILSTIGAGKPADFIIAELVNRLGRNCFIVMALIIPVIAGLGLNFAIVLGAMAGQAALVMVTHWKLPGLGGFAIAALITVPIAAALGWFAGTVLNRAKGREMIASMILGFFMNGVYQLVFLYLVGTLIPLHNPSLLLPAGVGLRNTVDLKYVKYVLDYLVYPAPLGIGLPLVTFAVIALLCLGIRWLLSTKLGQDMRAVGQDMNVAGVSGIHVDRTRITAMVFSTVLAGLGQLIFLQNIGTFNTYNSHEQVGTFAIAALLVGGASVTRATIGQALLGTFLFHLLFIVSPYAGQRLLGSPQVGEYFRVFMAYAVICLALALHAWQKRRRASG
ncbi:MAG: ABC transporter permease [Chloroflexota bacterium]